MAINGGPGNNDPEASSLGSFFPAISGDGRAVAFFSAATNLVRGDTNHRWDAFVRQLR